MIRKPISKPGLFTKTAAVFLSACLISFSLSPAPAWARMADRDDFSRSGEMGPGASFPFSELVALGGDSPGAPTAMPGMTPDQGPKTMDSVEFAPPGASGADDFTEGSSGGFEALMTGLIGLLTGLLEVLMSFLGPEASDASSDAKPEAGSEEGSPEETITPNPAEHLETPQAPDRAGAATPPAGEATHGDQIGQLFVLALAVIAAVLALIGLGGQNPASAQNPATPPGTPPPPTPPSATPPTGSPTAPPTLTDPPFSDQPPVTVAGGEDITPRQEPAVTTGLLDEELLRPF